MVYRSVMVVKSLAGQTDAHGALLAYSFVFLETVEELCACQTVSRQRGSGQIYAQQ